MQVAAPNGVSSSAILGMRDGRQGFEEGPVQLSFLSILILLGQGVLSRAKRWSIFSATLLLLFVLHRPSRHETLAFAALTFAGLVYQQPHDARSVTLASMVPFELVGRLPSLLWAIRMRSAR